MKIIISSWLVPLLICTVGCSDSFLDEADVFRELDTNTFYQTEADAVSAVNSVYAPLNDQGLFKRFYMYIAHFTGETALTNGTRTNEQVYVNFNFNPASGDLIPRAWSDCYKGINRANQVIERVPEIDAPNEDLLNRVVAEAKFLRAFYYFELVKLYGNVPIYNQIFNGDLSDEDQLFPSQSPASEVYQVIEDDLLDAIPDLPESYNNANVGRATSGAAKSLLGKAYLYQGEYQSARDILAEVINSGVYSLEPDFANIFPKSNENNDESIFEVQFQSGFGAAFDQPNRGGANEANWMSNWFSPARVAFRNSVPGRQTIEFFEQFPEEDAVRRTGTYAQPGDVWGDWNPIAEDPVAANQWRDRQLAFPDPDLPMLGIRKYAGGPNDPESFNQNAINYRVIRLADVLLMFAEAENEVSGPTVAAYDAVNQVRARAGVAPFPPGLDANAFFDRLRTERRLELTYEYSLFFDLVRWAREEKVSSSELPEIMTGFTVGKNEVLPIPEGELIDNPNLEQNPGY
ncbi:RagB/SusD family nutrient uptake outer membrane protein [Tunicatimonas pelagia]|uniref:RagB/SusD family nutrient uptake outer membrane protein n=1 Tax=Tunicatimonas pelagia TaxID=931531 RepID=UPI002665F103|nr:RagB/SusD family nutrient uptake outer membrane protein [Tunicatimonas pelagia]WKN43754.1 RagB/SusD family nutrient uptake outer membrane protein [Tunicatimonas pelagia]